MVHTAIIIIISEFIALSVICFVLMRYFKSPMVTNDVAVSGNASESSSHTTISDMSNPSFQSAVYVSWVMGFAGTLLLPYDLSLAVVTGERITALDNVWACIYWRFVS